MMRLVTLPTDAQALASGIRMHSCYQMLQKLKILFKDVFRTVLKTF